MLAEPGQQRMRVALEAGEAHGPADREIAAAGRGLGHTGHPADGSAAGRAARPAGRAQRSSGQSWRSSRLQTRHNA